MRLRTVLVAGSWPRVQVAGGELAPGHRVLRHYYRTGLAHQPRALSVSHLTRYECSCGREWFGTKPCVADLLRHDEARTS
jgi:hypothetical protein